MEASQQVGITFSSHLVHHRHTMQSRSHWICQKYMWYHLVLWQAVCCQSSASQSCYGCWQDTPSISLSKLRKLINWVIIASLFFDSYHWCTNQGLCNIPPSIPLSCSHFPLHSLPHLSLNPLYLAIKNSASQSLPIGHLPPISSWKYASLGHQ